MTTRAVICALVGLTFSFGPSRAFANDGTIRRYVMPIASFFGTFLPHFNYHWAPSSGQTVGFGFRVAPVSFFANGAAGEVMFVPFLDFDLAPDPAWKGSLIRVSHGLRTTYFPLRGDFNFLGVHADGGGSLGFGGPSGLLGGGLTLGGKMALSFSYRHAWGRDENIHTVSIELGLTYPVNMGAARAGE